MSFCSK